MYLLCIVNDQRRLLLPISQKFHAVQGTLSHDFYGRYDFSHNPHLLVVNDVDVFYKS